MSLQEFFIRLIALVSVYINAFLEFILSSPFFIPFSIVLGCACVMLVFKFLRG